MLRPQARRLVNSFLRTRSQLNSASQQSLLRYTENPLLVGYSLCTRTSTRGRSLRTTGKEAAQSQPLSSWLLDSWLGSAKHFSSAPITRQAKDSTRETKAAEAYSDEKARENPDEGTGSSKATSEDPYASLTEEELRSALRERDGSISASTAQAEELTDMLKRTLADMENLRQRTAKQAESSQKFAIQGFLKSLLDVGDNLERAYGSVPRQALQGKDQNGNSLTIETAISLLNGIVNGLQLTDKIFNQALQENGVEKFRPEGEKFDPNLHEALFELPDATKDPGTVAAVTKTGYLLNGRVVRPAQVGVEVCLAQYSIYDMPVAPYGFKVCARSSLGDTFKNNYEDLGRCISKDQFPIVYSAAYNVKLFGLEKLHPFDAAKFEKVKRKLEKGGFFKASQLVEAKEATKTMLQDVHTEDYVNALHTGTRKLQEDKNGTAGHRGTFADSTSQLHSAEQAAQATAIPYWGYHAGEAIALAVERGWSINLGGGMHHAYAQNGGGWCAYDDWTLALRRLRSASQGAICKALYVDLDVHQGNGVARDRLFFSDKDIFILDMYNRELWPGDSMAKKGIDHEVTFASGCGDEEYLTKLEAALTHSFQSFKPDILLYNAGTDILDGDPLGRCKISASAVIKRDEMVWQAALDHQVPICMALSGGYAKGSADVIARCLAHLMQHFKLADN